MLLVRTLGSLATDDAVLALQRSVDSLRQGGRLLVHEDRLDAEELDEHETEADLLGYALHGTGVRTDAELRALFAAADLDVADAVTFGWGSTLYLLEPRG